MVMTLVCMHVGAVDTRLVGFRASGFCCFCFVVIFLSGYLPCRKNILRRTPKLILLILTEENVSLQLWNAPSEINLKSSYEKKNNHIEVSVIMTILYLQMLKDMCWITCTKKTDVEEEKKNKKIGDSGYKKKGPGPDSLPVLQMRPLNNWVRTLYLLNFFVLILCTRTLWQNDIYVATKRLNLPCFYLFIFFILRFCVIKLLLTN